MTPKNCATKEYRKLTGSKAMTKKALKKSVKAFWRQNLHNNCNDFAETLDRALNCGALDLESKNQGDNGATRIVVCYILQKMLDGCQPLYSEDKKDLANLLKF
jgi:hypothetical protein